MLLTSKPSHVAGRTLAHCVTGGWLGLATLVETLSWPNVMVAWYEHTSTRYIVSVSFFEMMRSIAIMMKSIEIMKICSYAVPL